MVQRAADTADEQDRQAAHQERVAPVAAAEPDQPGQRDHDEQRRGDRVPRLGGEPGVRGVRLGRGLGVPRPAVGEPVVCQVHVVLPLGSRRWLWVVFSGATGGLPARGTPGDNQSRPLGRRGQVSQPWVVNHASRSRVVAPVLSIRGTLFCPPALPRDAIHASNPPRRTARTSGRSIVRSPTRCTA